MDAFFLGIRLISKGQMAEPRQGTSSLCCLLFFRAVYSEQGNRLFYLLLIVVIVFSSVRCRGGEGVGKEGHEERGEQFPPGPRVTDQNTNIKKSY